MKILFTGGGTGGHFYPIIAIAQEINELSKQYRLLPPQMYFMSTDPYDEGLLFENNITFVGVSAGKIRKSFSIANKVSNFFDWFKTFFGVISATWKIFIIYPDVVFGKGAYASFPALFAARILRIPVVIHESDSSPGKVNRWAGKFAKRVAISYPEAINYFDQNKTAFTGNPVRKEIQEPQTFGAHEFFKFTKDLPVIFILGGSQGAKFINEIILRSLSELVKKYQIIHHTGVNNLKIVEESRDVILLNNPLKDRYRPLGYLDVLNMRMASGSADLIISRAGSTIFEIALWGKPSIIVPIPEPTSHDQHSNAFSYARTGAAIVMEEKNLSEGPLLSEIERILNTPDIVKKMSEAAKNFARTDAAKLIAAEILSIAVEHEK